MGDSFGNITIFKQLSFAGISEGKRKVRNI